MSVALVTGANRGIGLEICRQLADRGYDVILTGRDEEKARAACERLWDEGLDTVVARPLDVTSDASVLRLRDRVEQEFGELHALVNTAGVGLGAGVSALEPDFELIRTTLETNTLGALRVAAAFVPLLRRTGAGRIVNVTSGMSGIGVTRMLAAELDGTRVLVNAARPGPSGAAEDVDTPVWLATLPGDGPTGGVFRDRQPVDY